jgi:quinol monooxygenase YgiN
MRLIRKPPMRHSPNLLGRSAALSALTLAAAIAVVPAARAQTSNDAVYAVTYLDVATTSINQGLDLIKKFREASRKEAANLEFTVMQEEHRPNRFVIAEGWKDKAAFDGHDKGTAKAEFEAALMSIRNSPPDRHMLQPFANAPARATPASGSLYMVEHVDFLGGDPSVATTAAPMMKALAEATQKEAGAVRYDVYRQPAPRINHYEVVAVWANEKAYDAHETAAHTRGFRAASAQGTKAWRCNLYDQRLYKVL